MKPKKFINQLNQNFEEILSLGFISEGELKEFSNFSTIDSEHLEGIVMRLYFLTLDPEKDIKFFINQYEENRYLYLVKITEEVWLFVMCSDSNFAKLHFFIKYMLSDVVIDFDDSEPQDEEKLTVEQEKLLSAQRIQQMLLPDLDKQIPSFKTRQLHYKPKDIVGGDFYWAKKTKTHEWIVVGDCTGHSVEGALGSVSVMSILNEVFYSNMNPHHLIKALHESLNNMQSQDLVDGYGIGVELMVMKYEPKTKTLKYSSNGLTLYLIDDRVRHFKTKKSSFDPDRVIKYIRSRTIHLDENRAVFTHSDGIPDQLNSEGKKLKTAKLRRTLGEGGDGNSIRQLFDDWKNEEIQTDDVVSIYLKP